MNIAQIDYISIKSQSFFHRSGSFAKMVLAFFLLASIIFSSQTEKLLLLALILFSFFLLARLNLFLVFKLLLYPLIFTLIFIFFTRNFSSYGSLTMLLKATTAALSMIWLILTTPYIEIFSILAKFLPSLLVDVFFFTYRTFFILLEKLQNSLKIMSLRGDYGPFKMLKNIKNTSLILGNLLINSFEMNERSYKIYSLRGYDSSLPLGKKELIERPSDYLLIILGFLIFLGVLLPWTL